MSFTLAPGGLSHERVRAHSRACSTRSSRGSLVSAECVPWTYRPKATADSAAAAAIAKMPTMRGKRDRARAGSGADSTEVPCIVDWKGGFGASFQSSSGGCGAPFTTGPAMAGASPGWLGRAETRSRGTSRDGSGGRDSSIESPSNGEGPTCVPPGRSGATGERSSEADEVGAAAGAAAASDTIGGSALIASGAGASKSVRSDGGGGVIPAGMGGTGASAASGAGTAATAAGSPVIAAEERASSIISGGAIFVGSSRSTAGAVVIFARSSARTWGGAIRVTSSDAWAVVTAALSEGRCSARASAGASTIASPSTDPAIGAASRSIAGAAPSRSGAGVIARRGGELSPAAIWTGSPSTVRRSAFGASEGGSAAIAASAAASIAGGGTGSGGGITSMSSLACTTIVSVALTPTRIAAAPDTGAAACAAARAASSLARSSSVASLSVGAGGPLCAPSRGVPLTGGAAGALVEAVVSAGGRVPPGGAGGAGSGAAFEACAITLASSGVMSMLRVRACEARRTAPRTSSVECAMISSGSSPLARIAATRSRPKARASWARALGFFARFCITTSAMGVGT